MSDYSLPQWHYLNGAPEATGVIRAQPDHFQVHELLPFTPDGEGEHHLLHVEKRDLTTHQLARMLAAFAKVPARDVSWAGLKDRHGITRQWMCVRIPGKDTPDWPAMNDERITVLEAHRHLRKLRPGVLAGNRFTLAVSRVSDIEAVNARLKDVAKGVPNYFGEQRFGHGGANVYKAAAMFGGRKVKDRNKRGIYLSAVRSFLFNHVVSHRLATHGRDVLDGDTVMLKGSNSFFTVAHWDAEPLVRLAQGDIELSAPLPGDGDGPSQGDSLALEQQVLAQWPELLEGLKAVRMDPDRRRVLLKPDQLKTRWDGDTLWLEFVLPPGAFATAILRELVDYTDAQEFDPEKATQDAGMPVEPAVQPVEAASVAVVQQAETQGEEDVQEVEPLEESGKNNRMKILISNDDGVHAPGIKALSDALSRVADTLTVAPDRNCSGASNSLTLTNPLRVQKLDNGYLQVNGTPTDCVHLAIRELMEGEPDLVVSGINAGANLGDDTLYSGTVAAAMEGRHLGLPTLAVSLVGSKLEHYETAAEITRQIVEGLLARPLASEQILNINVPDLPLAQIQGIKVTRLGARHKAEGMVKTQDPAGRDVYWLGPPGTEQDAGEGTDFHAVANGYVSVTPLTADLTAHQQRASLTRWFEQL